MAQVKLYHYTSLSRAISVFDANYQTPEGKIPGVVPGKHIGTESLPAADTLAAFALLESKPETWVNNPHFPGIWKVLSRNIAPLEPGKILLEIGVDTKTNNVVVGDRGHFEGFLYRDKTGIPEKYLHKTLAEGEKAYMQELVPLDKYLERRDELQYSLPEVVILSTIPPERVKVSMEQPFLKSTLEGRNLLDRDNLIYAINHGALAERLTPWKEKYEATHGPLEIKPASTESYG